MNRKYLASEYADAVSLIRDNIEYASFTTDVIVGFPGETDEDFNQSFDFVSKIGFAKVHIFPYSKRKGTKAAAMKNQITKQIKKDREQKLANEVLKSRTEFLKSHVGKVLEVLTEQCENGICTGFTKNYLTVDFEGKATLCNSIVKVTITDADGEKLYGRIN
jgi:threonylcarbamoyladenosine tRNA methylthiotransferase MtaB